MQIVDADAHVIENERTWEYLEPGDRDYRPIPVDLPGVARRSWYIDGKLRGLGARHVQPELLADISRKTGRNVSTPADARDLRDPADVEARLRHMTELGIDVQILLPTIFIEQVADRPEVEVALCRAYNRWLAEIWRAGRGRLRWIVVPPTLAMDRALEEIRRGREHGACGIFLRGIEGDRLPSDPYFDPLYREAEGLDMPVIVHVGNGNPNQCELLSRYNPGLSFWKYRLPVVGAMHAIASCGLPARYPRLRFGFLEASSQWVPFVLDDLRDRMARQGVRAMDNLLRDYRMYVACDPGDDVPWIAHRAGEDNLVIGTDYGHLDTSSQVDAIRKLRERPDLSATLATKITSTNPTALYGL